MGLNHTSEQNVIVVWISSELQNSISIVSIYYGTQSGIWEKKLLSFEFAESFNIQFWACRCITGLNQTSELKVIVVWICWELQHSISSVSIYYEAQSNIGVKSYHRLNLLRASTVNFECLNILRDSVRQPSRKLLSFEFFQSFDNQFRASRHISGLNQTSE